MYAERLEVLASRVSKHLSAFVEPRVPVGGLQMPCMLTCDLSERDAVDAARRFEIDLMGLSALHAAGTGEAGFLMGFAAYTPAEIEIGVRKLAKAFQSIASKKRR